MFVILMFYKALILGEIWCWSLLGLKGLNPCTVLFTKWQKVRDGVIQVDPMLSNSGFVNGFIMQPLQYMLYIIRSPETQELILKILDEFFGKCSTDK